MKKYNNQTGCYKIDIYYKNEYLCSTEQSKTLKAAKERFLFLHPEINPIDIKCIYSKN